jgi:hypothetical protein
MEIGLFSGCKLSHLHASALESTDQTPVLPSLLENNTSHSGWDTGMDIYKITGRCTSVPASMLLMSR